MKKKEGFNCLGPSNWTICSRLSPFYSRNFQFVSTLYREANSDYPRGLRVRKGSFPIPEVNETVGFECMGPSDWAICNRLSPSYSGNFQCVSTSYWEANFYYPRGLIVRKESFPNSRNKRDSGF